MELNDALRALVGERYVVAGDAIEPRYLTDWSPVAHGKPRVLVRPGNQAEVAAVLRLCNERRQPVVVQGGMTSLVGGGVPQDGECVLAMERLNRIEEVDPAGEVMVVEAGATLASVNEAAAPHGLMFPLDLAARGSCRIGGNISTNAGGNRVIRFGNTRELVLGLDVTLADGTRLDMTNRLLKNNTGYDMKHLFIGGEGTLGVVTRAVLRVFPITRSQNVALCGLANFESLVRFLGHARRELGASISAFEIMWREFYEMALEVAPAIGKPLAPEHEIYALIETMGNDPDTDRDQLERTLASAIEQGMVANAVVARSVREVQDLWHVRDAIAEISPKLRPGAGFDVSISIHHMPAFVAGTRKFFAEHHPQARYVIFGHLGDSNLHVTTGPFPREGPEEKAISHGIYQLVRECGGSISAEHGIGQRKKAYLAYSRTPEEIAAMRGLKQLFDPNRILNPGRIFD